MGRSFRVSEKKLKEVNEIFKRTTWTQDHLAGRADCKRQTVNKFLAGGCVDKRIFDALCIELKLTVAEIAHFEAEEGQFNTSISVNGNREQSLATLTQKQTETDEERVPYAATGTIAKSDIPKVKAILALLQEITGDTSIKIVDIEKGSIKLILEGSQESLEQIEALFKAGQLTEVVGILVEDVQFVTPKIPEHDEDVQAIDKKRLAFTLAGSVSLGEIEELKAAFTETLDNSEEINTDDKASLVQEITTKGASGRNLSRTNLRGAYLSNVDLSRADLRGADLSNADLNSANLNSVFLNNTNLNSAFLCNANLSFANLRNSVDLSFADLSYADLHSANLGGALLTGANLVRAYRKGTYLVRTRRADTYQDGGANLNYANLSYANLSYANLSGANLSDAVLTRANLSDANLSSAKLIGADLSSANLFRARLFRANLSGANLNSADLSRTDLFRAKLISANLNGANLSHANLSGANLNNAQIKGAQFGFNLGISEEMKQDLIKRGAIFEDSPGDRSGILSPH